MSVANIVENLANLIQKGEYNQAMNRIDKIIKKGLENEKERNQVLFWKSKILVKKGDYLGCLEIIEGILNSDCVSSELMIELLLMKAFALGELAQFDEEIEVIAILEDLLANYKHDSKHKEKWTGFLHELKGWYYTNKTEFEEAKNHLQKSIEIFEHNNDSERLASVYTLMGILNLRKGEYDIALEYYQRSLKIRKELGNKYDVASSYLNIAIIYQSRRLMSEALSYFDRVLSTIEESENNHLLVKVYNGYGNTFFYLGNLSKAFEFFEKALFYVQLFGNKQHIAYILSNIGSVQKLRGNLDEALTAFLHCLEIFDEIGNIQAIGAKLLDIGEIFLQKGEKQKALTFLKKGLEYRRKTGNSLFISVALYNLINYFSFIKNTNETQKYLAELNEINEKTDTLLIKQIAKVAKALVLIMDNRSKSRAKAEELLSEIVKNEMIDFKIYTDAAINLCDLLVNELKITGNQEVLLEINGIIEKLEKTAQKQKSFWLQIEVYWLKAKLALLSWDVNLAQQLLADAQLIAEKKGLMHLAQKISQEFDKTLNQLEIWKQLKEKDASVTERLEITQLDDLLDNLKQQIINIEDLPPDQPVMLLLIKQTGQPIFNKNFLPERIDTDDALISGYLASINFFFEEVFEASGSIERIKHKDLTILLKPIESILFCYIFKGQSYSAIKKIDEYITLLKGTKEIFWRELLNQIDYSNSINIETEKYLLDIASGVF